MKRRVVARELVARLTGRITVDATGEQSRFVYKSMRFRDEEGTENRCLLECPKREARPLPEGVL